MNQNNINWYEWCEKTLKIAKELDKSIFVYISYKSCKLCKKMETEVFNNKRCYEYLNENFIPIKVDRFKRADIDKYFQKAHNLINKSQGGWPLCAFTTPDAKVFFTSNYMNLESSGASVSDIGLVEAMELISKRISSNDKATYKNADEIYQFLHKNEHPTQATKLSEDFVKNYLHQVKGVYQTKYGGFSNPPKFPQVATLNALIKIDELYNDNASKAMVTTTLKNLAKKCIDDSGVSRYYNSDDWSDGCDEKTLYDNTLLCETFSLAFVKYGDDIYLDAAKVCNDFSLSFDSDITAQKAMMVNSIFTLSSIDSDYIYIGIKELNNLLKNYKVVFLEDFAFISQALIKSYYITKDQEHLIEAIQFINTALERFYNYGGWLFYDNEFKTKADTTDYIYTSCVSIMVQNLLELHKILKDEKYLYYSYKTLEYNSYKLARDTIYFPSLLKAMLNYIKEK